MADNPTKPKVMSFFPLWKLKGTQPVKTPAVWVAHLEEDSADKEESAESDDPDGIEGHDRGVYSAPSQSSKGSSAGWETLLPLQQPRTFYPWMPFGEGIQNSQPFKPKGGDSTREGSLDPSSQGGQAKGTPGGDAQGIGALYTDSLLESQSLPPMVWDQKCSQGKD